MATEYINGQMEKNMMDNGRLELEMEKEFGKEIMETTIMLETGKTIEQKVMERTHGQMVILL